ncbi:MAG: FAD-dependent oxidoreductase [Actinomycetales bacterium]|nr:FAD-dependent oxidoreductase [Actinomycetales bacterium]
MPALRSAPSLWAELSTPVKARPALIGNSEVDVVIVGAGFTGLWTAYYLQRVAPELKITVLEAKQVGFGASGRNGGWCSALFPASTSKLSAKFGLSQARRMYHAMVDNLQQISEVIAAEGIECDWNLGGTVVAARNSVQLTRAKSEVAEHLANNLPAEDLQLLSLAELSAQINVAGAVGGTFTPHCAALNPLKLVTALADLVESRGAEIYENTAAIQIQPKQVITSQGIVKAKFVIRATEGYSAKLPTFSRNVAPIYSMMIATEPLTSAQLAEIGLAQRQTFSDFRNLIIYGQRTADNRIAFGGRGAPYHFGSRISPDFDRNQSVQQLLVQTLSELFPILAGVKITNHWGGPLGVTRDWMASCGLDRMTGLGWAGGYVGDGVNTSNLAGQTLAHLITGTESDLTKLPWVNYRSRNWEPEPLRWLGVNAGLWAVRHADQTESKRGRSSVLLGAVNRLTGG